jgi:LDH2 family malate/lactate/ureidoglycolate dehydrogenase
MNRYDPEIAKRQVADIAIAAGLNESDARIFADSLVEADVYGKSTHGISRVDIYIRRIQRGLIDPRAEIVVDRERSSVIAVDAGNGLGQVQACKVLDKLIPMAEAAGIASATIRNSQHFGSLSYYCNKAAQINMILFATTNSEPAMAPEGGREAYFGTNPMAASFPTGKGYHVTIDLSTSIVARGNIISAHKKGEAIPLGWALDTDGNPTEDPGQALLGTVLTMAGHKGYALALMVELFSGVLSGAAVGSDIGSMYKNMTMKQNVGHFFYLLDIDAFMDITIFKKRVDAMIDKIKACNKRPGVEEIMVPGERSYKTAQENRKKGIHIDNETRKELKTLCEELNVSYIL